MIRWIWRLIVGKSEPRPCARDCQWECVDRSQSIRLNSGDHDVIAVVYTLRCTTCGDMKDHRSGV